MTNKRQNLEEFIRQNTKYQIFLINKYKRNIEGQQSFTAILYYYEALPDNFYYLLEYNSNYSSIILVQLHKSEYNNIINNTIILKDYVNELKRQEEVENRHLYYYTYDEFIDFIKNVCYYNKTNCNCHEKEEHLKDTNTSIFINTTNKIEGMVYLNKCDSRIIKDDNIQKGCLAFRLTGSTLKNATLYTGFSKCHLQDEFNKKLAKMLTVQRLNDVTSKYHYTFISDKCFFDKINKNIQNCILISFDKIIKESKAIIGLHSSVLMDLPLTVFTHSSVVRLALYLLQSNFKEFDFNNKYYPFSQWNITKLKKYIGMDQNLMTKLFK